MARNKQRRNPMNHAITPEQQLVAARAFMQRQVKIMETICYQFLLGPITGRERQSLDACIRHFFTILQGFDTHTEELKTKEADLAN